MYAGIPYEAVCENETHKQWLDNILDMAIFAILVQKKGERNATKEDKEVANSITTYFNSTVQAATKFLKAHGLEAKKDDMEVDGGRKEVDDDDDE